MIKIILGAAALIAPAFASASGAPDGTYDWRSNLPTHYVFADDTDLGLSVKYQYDLNRFSHDDGLYENAQTNRRKELGFFIGKKGAYDATAVFDLQARTWLDVFFRLQTLAIFNDDYGAVRAGFMKTPVGFEGNTSTGSTSFLEPSLPMQAIYANRRIGIDWALIRTAYLVQLGYYNGGNLQGDLDGRMVAGRAAWTPLNDPGDVLHLGGSVSREWPQGVTDGRGPHTPPAVRLHTLPEAGLTSRALIDSGVLSVADHVDRRGLEGVWIRGPWSVQSEYVIAKVKLADKPSYMAHGWYAFGSWVVTGESRGYTGGNVSDVLPKGPWGALELLIRYSTLDLDDDSTQGGKAHAVTFGANWYLTKHLKLQGNYVRASSDRHDVRVDPHVLEVRAQIMF